MSLDSGIQAAEGWIYFVQNLVEENCVVVSTVSLISRAIHNLFVTKATATIVVPFWPSSFFGQLSSRNLPVPQRIIRGSTLGMH